MMPQPTDPMEARHVLQLLSQLGVAVGSIGASTAALQFGEAEGIRQAHEDAMKANRDFIDLMERIGQHYGA